MVRHRIEWLNRPGTIGVTWSPVTGCTPVSEGCTHCFARRMARRLAGRCGYPPAPHEFDVTLHAERLDEPFKWRKPRTVFVCSMGDFFHGAIPIAYQCEILQVISKCPQHTFLILTKRAEQLETWHHVCGWHPYPNLWLGVTVENQDHDDRIHALSNTPAAVRFVSVEPMLGPVNIRDALYGYPEQVSYRTYISHDMAVDAGDLELEGMPYTDDEWEQTAPPLDWVICGAETGPDARPMDLDWARALRDQCVEAGVPFFFKRDSDGNRTLDGLEYHEWPNPRGANG